MRGFRLPKPSKIHRQCRTETSSVPEQQKPLLDMNGSVPFNFLLDATAVDGCPGLFRVADMRLALAPFPNNSERAVTATIEALCQLRRSLWTDPANWEINLDTESLLEKYGIGRCVAIIRRSTSDGIVRAIRTADGLELNIPGPALWSECGLDWLKSHWTCCPRERHNPTPWLGRACDCAQPHR